MSTGVLFKELEMLKKSLLIAVSILLLLVSNAFGTMDAKKAEALVNDYLQTLSRLKPHLANFEDASLTMEQMDAALHQANVKDNILKSAFMADEFYKSPPISENKLPKEEYLVIDNVTEHTEQKIVGSESEGDYCLVTVLIVNNEDKWKVKNTYKVVTERGKYGIYPSKSHINGEGSATRYAIDPYHSQEYLEY